MSARRSTGTSRSFLFVNTLLLSSALVVPAFAQIEEVVVTAQKKTEDIQSVPIAMSAYTPADLQAHQMVKFSDLQFASPAVTYTQTQYQGANVQIRGIGNQVVGAGGESGISVDFANVYLAYNTTDTGTFYDLQDVEVLRGPQSTLYGRGATGGAINISPARPDLDTASVQVDAQYGNYDYTDLKGAVNLPIIDGVLGARIAGEWLAHDGFTTNIADNSHQDDRDQYSVRGELRWEPTDRTTVDFLAQFSNEDDRRARGDKALCSPDPTGVLGCSPGPLSFSAPNLNGSYLNILAGKQGYANLLGSALAAQDIGALLTNPAFAGFRTAIGPAGVGEIYNFGVQSGLIDGTASGPGGNVPALLAALPPSLATTELEDAYYGNFSNPSDPFYHSGLYGGQALGSALGLVDLTQPVAPASNGLPSNPANYRQVNDDFNPTNLAQDNFLSTEVKQNITSWLDADFVGSYGKGSYFNQQSFTNTGAASVNYYNPANLATAEAYFLGGVVGNPAFGGNPSLENIYSQFFSNSGKLPVSNFTNFGIVSGVPGPGVNRYSSDLSANDQSSGESDQYSGELRFNSKFKGPVNFMVGAYYLHEDEESDYYVAANSLDYASIVSGAISSLVNGTVPGTAQYAEGCYITGCVEGAPYYHNYSVDTLKSKALYGEVYYDILPDLLKLTVGARYTEDQKTSVDRITVLSGTVPIGSNNEMNTLSQEAEACEITSTVGIREVCGFDPNNTSTTSGDPFIDQETTFRKATGRAVLDWTPQLSFTDKTLVFASYSRGYKAGGFNPGAEAGLAGLPLTYAPEQIDAYEIGTKNIALDGHLQINGGLWYYDYTGLQISAIIDNTSVNQNINARLYGAEGQFVYLPTDNLRFELNTSFTHSGVGNISEVDPRNPAGNDPRAIVIKDQSISSTGAENCVIYDLNATTASQVTLPTGYTYVPTSTGVQQAASFSAPSGGIHALQAQGIPNVAYGSCNASAALTNFLAAQGFSEYDPAYGGTPTGSPVNLKGNELAETPAMSLSAAVQYTFELPGDYTLVPRADYYFQTHTWGRIFEDASDLIKGWGVANAQITLNNPDGTWYVGAYIKNAFDSTYVTGQYLQSSSSGLYTNVFLGDPRTYGLQAGIHF